MRAAAVAALTEDESGVDGGPCRERLQLARRVAEKIRSPRLSLLCRLRLTDDRDRLEVLLGPAALYRGIASTEAIDDELRALTALLTAPAEPKVLDAAFLSDIRDKERRILGLVDLARHALAFQERAYRRGRRDPIAALQPIVDAMGGVSSETLVSLAPELAALGARVGPSRAVAEFKRTFRWLFDQTAVPWSSRLEALQRLVASFDLRFLNADDTDPRRLEQCRIAATLLRWILEAPWRSTAKEIEILRRRWHELLPTVMAAAADLPPPSQLYLRYPFGARLCLEWLWPLSAMIDLDRLRSACAWLDGLLDPRWLRQSAASFWPEPGSELLGPWDRLEPEQQRVVMLCFAAPETWPRRARELISRPEKSMPELEALIDLLAGSEPRLVVELLGHVPASERKLRCLRPLRRRCLPGNSAVELAELLEEGPGRWQAVVWSGLGEEAAVSTKEWLKALAELVARGHLDPLSPSLSPIRRHLWNVDPELACPSLARAAIDALAAGGQRACMNALRLWLHAYLGHQPGHASPSGQQRCQAIQPAVERARTIPMS